MRNLSDEQAHPFLFAEAPRILFPFARRVVADAVRDAGYPPLMLEPIDFNGLYLQQLAARQAEQGEAGEGAAPPVGNA
jgi:preprotein translocase subunit SecB